MKFVKTNSGNVKITDDSDNLLAILPATTYIHLDPRYDTGLRLSSSANPDNEADTFRVNQALVTVPAGTSNREDLAEQLEANFFTKQSNKAAIITQALTETSTEVLASETRVGVSFVNLANADAYILLGSGTASATNYTVKLKHGGDDIYEAPYNYSGAVQVVFAHSGSGNLVITKFN